MKCCSSPRTTRVTKPLVDFFGGSALTRFRSFSMYCSCDMSLVGPRPPLPTEVDQYGDAALRRLLVKPGMTGLWQVSGRSDLSWEDTVRLDVYYVENWSVAGDLVIMARTFRAVLGRHGAY